ncbi:CRISPR DNA repeat-binding protein Cbp1 [Stygiolobus azoricus]|uniref:Helix-turn-helix domain-containing protein n=1 Tax=Stygiolobus azoricus TaxID=41675 RepID=A0A650CMX1_9CREN|nr:CRISPR DNA repeat-binding protein Cbp1 [Stygiolobus azoricus]QGR19012.1 helix-turn-helix domain-containing protein [Stygiolobus azoricus]
MMQNEMEEKVRSLYERGYSIRNIASLTGLSYGKVRNLLIKSGIKLRSNKADENKVIELAKQGKSARAISKELKISESTVLRILQKHNLGRRVRKLKDSEIKMIEDMYKRGEPIYKIAKKLGKSTNLIVYHLKKMGLYKSIRESSSTSL